MKHGGSWAYSHHKCRCDECVSWARAYYEQNRERIKANSARTKQRDRDRLRHLDRERYHQDPWRVMDRRTLSKPGGDEAAVAYRGVLRGDPCAYCGSRAGAVDHIIPASRGGDWSFANLTAACIRCNARKHNRSLLLFMAKGGLDAAVPAANG